MATLGQLQRSALVSCENRKHYMSHFTSLTDHSAIATCFNCGMEVYVTAKPRPNEIDVSGEAVALNCRPRPEATLDKEYAS